MTGDETETRPTMFQITIRQEHVLSMVQMMTRQKHVLPLGPNVDKTETGSIDDTNILASAQSRILASQITDGKA